MSAEGADLKVVWGMPDGLFDGFFRLLRSEFFDMGGQLFRHVVTDHRLTILGQVDGIAEISVTGKKYLFAPSIKVDQCYFPPGGKRAQFTVVAFGHSSKNERIFGEVRKVAH